MAADREDESVERYHDPLQPPVLRLVARVLETAEARGKPASVCGELAGDAAATAVLLALGARRFSVSRLDYPRVLESTGRLSIGELDARRDAILRARTGSEVRRLVEDG